MSSPFSLRLPCAGSSKFGALGNLWLGDCFQQFKNKDNGIPIYENVTLDDGGTVPVNGDNSSPLSCPVSASRLPDDSKYGNCYIPVSASVNFAACSHLGIKAVHSTTQWYGRPGFLQPCSVDPCANQPTTLYLRMVRSVQVSANGYDFNLKNYSCDASIIMGYAVNKLTGILSRTECTNVTCSDWSPDPMSCNFVANPHDECLNLFGADACDGVVIGSSPPNVVSTAGGPMTLTVTDDSITGTLSGNCTLLGGQVSSWNYNVSITLSDPYQLSDVIDTGLQMLNSWNLTDDALYPPRPDNDCNTNVIVKYDSVPAQVSPDGGISDCTMPYVDPSAAYYNGDLIGGPNPKGYGYLSASSTNQPTHFAFTMIYPGGNTGEWNPAPGELPYNATWWTNYAERDPSTSPYPKGAFVRVNPDGRVDCQAYVVIQESGTPSMNFFRPCGQDRVLMDESKVICVSSVAGGVITLYTAPTDWIIGQPVGLCSVSGYANGVYVLASTSSNDITLSGSISGSLIQAYDGYENCQLGIVGPIRFPGAWPICGAIQVFTSSLSASIVTVQLMDTASYLRSGDAVDFIDANNSGSSLDVNKIVTVSSSVVFLYTGSQPVPTDIYVKSHGAPDPKWNDSSPKGDFYFNEWSYNACTTTTDYNCIQGCNRAIPCYAKVMAILPNSASNFGNASVLTIPDSFTYADGVQWAAIPIATMIDPYWQHPHLNCDGSDPCVGGGGPSNCTASLVEGRCSPPSGSPALPSGITLGCQQSSDCTFPANGDCTTYISDAYLGV